MKSAIFLCASLTCTMHAQTAKVIPLSSQDAAMAKSLHEQKEALDNKLADFDAGILKHYLQVSGKSEGLTLFICKQACPGYKPGWESGFEYSEDFLFIVPKAAVINSASIPIGWPTVK